MSTSNSETYTDVASVRSELDVSADDVADDRIEAWIRRAVSLVSRRIPTENDAAHLKELQTLVAAHFGHARITGAESGQQVSAVDKADATIRFSTSSDGAGTSPFWALAVDLDPRLDDDSGQPFYAESSDTVEQRRDAGHDPSSPEWWV